MKSHFIRVSFSQNPQKVGSQIICYTFRLEKKWGIDFTPEAGPIVRAKFSPSGTASILEKGFLPKPKKKLITKRESEPLRQYLEKDTAVMDSVDRQPYGPTQRKISIWGEIYQDAMLMYEDILPIDVHLYEDENPASLTYY